MEDHATWEYESLRNAVCPECQMAHLPASETERCSEAIRLELCRAMQGMSEDEMAAHFSRMYALR